MGSINTFCKLLVSPLLPGRTAIAVTEFPDYVQRMMREDQNKKSMLASDYNVSVTKAKIHLVLQLLPTYTAHSVGSSKTTSSIWPSGLSPS